MLTKKENSKNESKQPKTSKTATMAQPHQNQDNQATQNKPSTATKAQTTATAQTKNQTATRTNETASAAERRQQKTRVTVKFDVGFSNQLYIRGKGANLSWDKGQPMRNIKADEWVWETETPFSQCEFKVLINDRQYEAGENHVISNGSNIAYSPKF